MTKHSFEEGFGLQTPMITGQLHVPRYYPYFKKAFKIEIKKRNFEEILNCFERKHNREYRKAEKFELA